MISDNHRSQYIHYYKGQNINNNNNNNNINNNINQHNNTNDNNTNNNTNNNNENYLLNLPRLNIRIKPEQFNF